MSPRAAWRLVELGYEQVYDYVAGKADWLAAGLPTEGPDAKVARAGGAADPAVPTCRPDERIGEVAARVEVSGHPGCVVVNDSNVVLGRLLRKHLEGDPDALAGEALEPGPTTARANEPLDQVLGRMEKAGVHSMLVTTPEGELIGLLAAPP